MQPIESVQLLTGQQWFPCIVLSLACTLAQGNVMAGKPNLLAAKETKVMPDIAALPSNIKRTGSSAEHQAVKSDEIAADPKPRLAEGNRKETDQRFELFILVLQLLKVPK